MPQPLSRVSPEGQLIFSAGVLRRSPFATDIAYVIGLWAHIDGDIASILSRMLNADISVGTAMFMSLIGSGGQKAALNAAAKEALPEWQYHLLSAVNKITSAARKQRNDFAHHVWGASANLPDALLLTEAKTVVEHNISHREVVERLDNGRGVIAPKPIDCSQIMVYRENDIEQAVADAERATYLYRLFYGTMDPRSGRGPVDQLLADISLHQHLGKLAENSDPRTKAMLKLI